MENGGNVELEVNSPDSGITMSGDSIQHQIKKDNVVDDLTAKFDTVLSSGDGSTAVQESENSADVKDIDISTDDSEDESDEEIELENQLQLNSNSFIECEKCEKPYNDPVLLSCLHSFCRQCVEDIIQSISTEEKPRAKCPSCGEVTRLNEGGVQKLKSNTFIERLASGNSNSECVCESHRQESDDKKAKVLDLLKELKTKGKSMELGDIEARLRNLEEAEANEIEKLESAFTSVLASIMKDKEDALKNLNKQFEKQRNYCSMRKRNAENFYNAIHTTTFITNKILDEGHPEELLALEDKICERIGRLLARTFRPSINFTSPSVDVKQPEKMESIYNVIPAKDLNPKSGRTKKKTPKKKNEQKKNWNSSGSGANNYNNLKKQGMKSGRNPPPLMSLPLVEGPQSVMGRQMSSHAYGGQAMSPPLPLSQPNSGPVYLRLVQRIDTAVQNDLRRPDLMGITCTAEGAVAVADHNNNRIKMFTPSGQFCEAFPALQPSSLAACGNIIAWSNHSMVHYNAKGRGCIQKLSFPSQGSVRHPHPVASYHNRQVLVAGIQKRYIRTYGLDGKRIQQVEQRAPDGSWLQKVVCVTVNSNGAYIMSDWDLNAVVFANSNGEPYAQYPPPMERGLHRNWLPGGLCGDHRGNIFVADGQGDRILLLNHRGQLLQEWSTSLYLPQPWSITCNHAGQLFVTGHDGYINVFQFGYQM